MAEERKKPTIEELEAILNDPTPQRIQLLPDGSICAVPDDSADLVKQARAEVLSSVLAKMDGPKMSHADLYRAIQELQPAAKDLEVLLREAELKAIKSSPECWHYNTETEGEFRMKYFAWRTKKITELEKARASEEEKDLRR